MAKKERTDLEVFQEIVDEIYELVWGVPRRPKEIATMKSRKKVQGWIEEQKKKPKRARTKKGRYKADDKSTKEINEAWEGGKAPKKKTRKK